MLCVLLISYSLILFSYQYLGASQNCEVPHYALFSRLILLPLRDGYFKQSFRNNINESLIPMNENKYIKLIILTK
jgi:hypothetical protein